MKAFKNLQAVILLSAIAAGTPITTLAGWDGVIGAGIGGLAGNQVGAGQGKTIATVVGAIAGYEVGNSVENSNNQQQNTYSQPNYGGNGYTYQQAQPQQTTEGGGFKQGVGTVAGGALGAVLGNQVGGGTGKTIMTVIGGLAGAYAGHSLTAPKEFVMRDAQGRSWVNGHQPMDPITEQPTFNRVVTQAQFAYGDYVNAANRASLAKNDYDWKRITIDDYYKSRNQMIDAGQRFNNARSELNDLASNAAAKYDKKIGIDQLLVIASCNAIPIGNSDMVSYQAVIQQGQRCSPDFKPGI